MTWKEAVVVLAEKVQTAKLEHLPVIVTAVNGLLRLANCQQQLLWAQSTNDGEDPEVTGFYQQRAEILKTELVRLSERAVKAAEQLDQIEAPKVEEEK